MQIVCIVYISIRINKKKNIRKSNTLYGVCSDTFPYQRVIRFPIQVSLGIISKPLGPFRRYRNGPGLVWSSQYRVQRLVKWTCLCVGRTVAKHVHAIVLTPFCHNVVCQFYLYSLPSEYCMPRIFKKEIKEKSWQCLIFFFYNIK